MTSLRLEVLLPAALDGGFDYQAEGNLAPGDVVRVPFGRAESTGVIWGKGKASLPPGKTKSILARHDVPPFSEAMRQFIDWTAWYNCAPKGSVLKMALPPGTINRPARLDFLKQEGALELPALSTAQQACAETLKKNINGGFSVTLLDGVTGSGKTEVYFHAIAEALLQSAQAQILVLLPEIALSVQWLKRFHRRFGFAPYVWNSDITPAQKRLAWHAAATGQGRVVVGARSALFLPYHALSLIVVDEEHDTSYKQEEGVAYHARDMAVTRARLEKIPIALVSATPSLETYHNAKQGKYAEIALPLRHGAAGMPDIEMLDMRSAPAERGAFIAQPLRRALQEAIANGRQAMLFLNRRGYAPLVLCRHCGHRFECRDCSSWLVLHTGKTGGGQLQCHHCGLHAMLPSACPSCGEKDSLHACGPGVERIAEEAARFLPGARIRIMASDHIEHYRDLQDTITAMDNQEIDVLIGTQMIAKGHHFAHLAAVGVVDADLGLAGADLRAAEKTYQMLHQLSGRAGRETLRGKVFLQSFSPQHPVMQALLSGDREAFLKAEIEARRSADLPPFSRLAAVIIESAKEEEGLKTARSLAARHTPQEGLRLLGPAPAPIFRVRGRCRWRLLVKARRSINLPDYMRRWVGSVDFPSCVRIRIDMDPVSFL